MKTLLFILFAVLLTTPCFAEDLYIAQIAAGADNGSSCANAKSASWFNTAGSWGAGAGKITAGDTAHLCGTITTTLSAQASGSAGSPITILFESGAKLSKAYWGNGSSGALYIPQSYIIVDGGTNGIIECTANGTGLANHQNSTGVYLSGGDHNEVKNLTIQNIYVRTAGTDEGAEGFGSTGSACIYGDGNWASLLIHDNILNNSVGGIVLSFATSSNTSIYNNYLRYIDHNIAIYGGTGTLTNTNIYGNRAGDYYNWDDTAGNWYHHNFLHFFINGTGTANGLNVYNNSVFGNFGAYATSHFYIEDPNGTGTFSNIRIFNNYLPKSTAANDPWGAIVVMGVGAGSIIANNTITGNKTNYGILLEGGTKNNVAVENNVITGQIYAIGHFYSNTANVTYDNNDYYDNNNIGNAYGGADYSTIASWRTYLGGCPNTGNECSSITSAPGLDANGVPQVGAAVIGAGVNLTSLGITALDFDIASVARPGTGAWDVGTYAYSTGDITAPSVTFTSSGDRSISSDSLSVDGTASDAVGVTSCKWRIGSAPDGSNGTALAGTTSWSGTTSGYSLGANTLYAGCTDAAGNWGSSSITVNYSIAGGTSACRGCSQMKGVTIK